MDGDPHRICPPDSQVLTAVPVLHPLRGATEAFIRARYADANSAAADAMNAALGNTVDPPEAVATAVIDGLRRDRRRVQLGGPERLFVRLNALLPAVVDRAMAGKLGTILRYATRPA
jgi:hypothetical protein